MKYRVTLPDGSIATRVSNARPYVACVARGPQSRDAHIATLKAGDDDARKIIEAYESAINKAVLVVRDRGFKYPDEESPYETHEVGLDGVAKCCSLPCSANGEIRDFGGLLGARGAITPALPHCVAVARHAISRIQETINWSENYINALSLGPDKTGRWELVCWSTKLSLANKKAKECRRRCTYEEEILVLTDIEVES